MKWFKHESAAHNDEKIRELIHETGVEGYGIMMICLELIAEKIDHNLIAEIEISWRVLSEKCGKRSDKLKSILKTSAFANILPSEFRKDKVKLYCPNLLKRLDNWTERSVSTTEQVSTNQNQKKNQNKKENKNKKNPSALFTDEQTQLLKNKIAEKQHHSPNTEANKIAFEKLVAGIAQDKTIKKPMAVALHRVENGFKQ